MDTQRKILVIEHCFECKNVLEDGSACMASEIYCDESGRCIDVDLRKVNFPEWCPLESVKKGE